MVLQVLGSHDISNVSDGTVTGAISDLSIKQTLHKTSGDHDSRYVQKSAILNTNTVTEVGYALDARQANPNISGSLGAQINSLNTNLGNRIEQVSTGVVNKNYLQMLKSDWSSNIGVFRPMYNPETNIVDLEADVNINGSTYYPNIRTTRAFNDGDGNNISITYLKNVDADKNFMMHRGYTTNADWAYMSGMYFTATETVGASDYGALLTVNAQNTGFNGGNWVFQVWFLTNGAIKTRRSINATDGGGWTAWETISKS